MVFWVTAVLWSEALAARLEAWKCHGVCVILKCVCLRNSTQVVLGPVGLSLRSCGDQPSLNPLRRERELAFMMSDCSHCTVQTGKRHSYNQARDCVCEFFFFLTHLWPILESSNNPERNLQDLGPLVTYWGKTLLQLTSCLQSSEALGDPSWFFICDPFWELLRVNPHYLIWSPGFSKPPNTTFDLLWTSDPVPKPWPSCRTTHLPWKPGNRSSLNKLHNFLSSWLSRAPAQTQTCQMEP